MSAPASGAWTDSHCHLQDEYRESLGELEPVLDRAALAGVLRAVCIGTGADSSRQALALAVAIAAGSADRPKVWASAGLHPHDAKQGTGEIIAFVEQNAPPPGRDRPAGSLVAVGECGLDYFYDNSPRDLQRQAFAEQIALARRLDLALVVHTRDAWEDTFELLAAAPSGPTVIHCFTGGSEEARRCLDLGAYLSFSGIVTFKNAEPVREAVAVCPRDRMLVETDSPFLAPVPHRGRPNEPAYVAIVGEAIAGLLGVRPEMLAEQTTENASHVFRLADR